MFTFHLSTHLLRLLILGQNSVVDVLSLDPAAARRGPFDEVPYRCWDVWRFRVMLVCDNLASDSRLVRCGVCDRRTRTTCTRSRPCRSLCSGWVYSCLELVVSAVVILVKLKKSDCEEGGNGTVEWSKEGERVKCATQSRQLQVSGEFR